MEGKSVVENLQKQMIVMNGALEEQGHEAQEYGLGREQTTKWAEPGGVDGQMVGTGDRGLGSWRMRGAPAH